MDEDGGADLHAQCLQLAFDVAKKAERAFNYELGDPAASFDRTGYLAGQGGAPVQTMAGPLKEKDGGPPVGMPAMPTTGAPAAPAPPAR